MTDKMERFDLLLKRVTEIVDCPFDRDEDVCQMVSDLF